MKCSQCNKPAFYRVAEAEIPLCLSCYATWHHTQNIDFLKNAVMMNHAMDNLDLSVGMGVSGDRIPVGYIAKAIQGAATLNQFSISNSQIGVLNTGSINRIEASITLAQGTDAELIAQHIKSFTEEVLTSNELGAEEKNEIIELTDAAAEEVVGRRRLTVVTAHLKALREKVGGILSLANAADKLLELARSIM